MMPSTPSVSKATLLDGRRCLEQANALVARERLEEGVVLYRRAATQVPGWHLPHFNLGAVLLRLGRDDAAREAFERAVVRAPGCWKSHFNLALLHLRHGRFVEGWQEYDWRFRADGRPAPRLGRETPVWDGRELRGETVLLCAEQGAGDLIQFVRFAPAVAARGARVFLECPASLRRLVATLPGIDALVDPTEPCSEADFQFPLMSVPRILGRRFTPCPIPLPYLKPPGGVRLDLDRLLGGDELFKIGVVWTGDPENPQNAVRSCRPEDFRPLSDLNGVRLYSLQYRDAGCSACRLEECGIRTLGPALGDFAEAAAIVERLDLIVTVDTATAHLAGALGRPTWVLLSQPCDWRWPTAGSESPWYPTTRLFRQSAPGDWTRVGEVVAAELMTGVLSRGRNKRRHAAEGSL